MPFGCCPNSVVDDKEEEEDGAPQPAKVGDFVQWTSGGVIQFPAPLRVVALSDDGLWLWVEGSQTGIAMSEVQIVEPPATGATPPSAPPSVAAALASAAAAAAVAAAGAAKLVEGMQEDKFSLDEGVVTIRFPENLTAASVEELEEFFALFVKKAKRRAKPN